LHGLDSFDTAQRRTVSKPTAASDPNFERNRSCLDSNATPQKLALTGLLQPIAAFVAPGGGMTIEHNAILIVDHVFLEMFGWGKSLVERHVTSAVRATARRQHIDGPIVFRWCFPIPAGMPVGCATFLLGRGHIGCRFAGGGLIACFLLVCGEPGLPFELQFEFDLIQFFLKALVFFEERRTPFPFRVDGSMQLPKLQFIAIRSVHQCANRCTPQVRAMAHIRATLFEFWVKAKRHRYPFRVRNADLNKNPNRHNINHQGGELNSYPRFQLHS
jgi:hypothetical protein